MKIKAVIRIFMLLFLLLWKKQGLEAAPITISLGSQENYVIHYPMFLVDPTQRMHPDQVAKSPFDQSELPTLSLGVTTAAVWVKIKLANHSKRTAWNLQIDCPPILQSVKVYRRENGRLIEVFSVDADRPRVKEQIRVNNLLIPLNIPEGAESEYYIRATSNNILRLSMEIITLQHAFEKNYLNDLLNGITFGILMAFAIYNLFVYLLTRETTYIFYLFYIFFWSLNVFFYHGYLPDFFSAMSWLNSAGTIIGLASLFSIFFTNSFLKTKIYSPFFYRAGRLMGILSLMVIFTDIIYKGAYAFLMIQYLMYPFFIYWFGAGFACLRKGYKPSIYFILGFGSLMMGNAIYNLKDIDILPENTFTRDSMHWGTLLESLILSFALADRLNFYQREKEKTQLKSIAKKKSFLRELLQKQENEKKRVAMELHDNIGQQLILIKNKAWRLQQLSDKTSEEAIGRTINHIADIITRVRSLLHRLRPYQMDLLGLTESINGMLAEVFSNHQFESEQVENINKSFDSQESIHIFRIIQMLADAIILAVPETQINYGIIQSNGRIKVSFSIEKTKNHITVIQDIYNRLNLLDGFIELKTEHTDTQISVWIPCRNLD